MSFRSPEPPCAGTPDRSAGDRREHRCAIDARRVVYPSVLAARGQCRYHRRVTAAPRIHRLEVHPRQGAPDPRAAALAAAAREHGFDLRSVTSARVYLIAGSLADDEVERVGRQLLADPITQQAVRDAAATRDGDCTIEVHPLPGVMDPVAQSTAMAVRDLVGREVEVKTGWRYDMRGVKMEAAQELAQRFLANTVIEHIHVGPYLPESFPQGRAYELTLTHVPLRGLDDAQLVKLSRNAHLFLSLEEMRAIAGYYRELGRDPTDVELETLAQTWSEHCVHKTLKSDIVYTADDLEEDVIDWTKRPGHERLPDGSIHIDNLLRSTVAAATHELIAEGLDWTLSVFVDNAGVIRFDDEHAVCVKVETHNHPSAIEPYGGAATGIGGCIRDVIGTGLAARPIASTDVFCVAPPDTADVPAGCLHPKRILKRVVEGVRDYGNRMGIPTVNGAVWFHDAYIGNPLVYCGCVGVMPSHLVHGEAQAGDHIIVLGGATGRDGIHGATFSSAELTDSHADEFSHAVQIGNAIEEKRTLDAILRARDALGGPLYHAITDCGAGGFSSAVGEMGEKLGAEVHLERAPLKYEGLSYTEIWISEAQERMVLAVPPEHIGRVKKICAEESVAVCDLGVFGTPGADLILNYEGTEVGRLSMDFLHNGLPQAHRKAHWQALSAPGSPRGPAPAGAERHAGAKRSAAPGTPASRPPSSHSIPQMLRALLAHPNIASKHWIIRQYDHEVQGGSAVKPLTGPRHTGPSDAAVIRPVLDSLQGLAIASGLATAVGLPEQQGDPYLMTLAAVDECVRNLVCTGADPSRIAILDNFCWPSCDTPEALASLMRAAEGCYDAAKAYRTPFISGKDSLNNQFTTESGERIYIPPTLLITGVGIVPDVRRCVTMDAKPVPSRLFCVGETHDHLRGSHAASLEAALAGPSHLPRTDLSLGPRLARAVHELIQAGLVLAAHDCSDGGLLVAAAEMAFAGSTAAEPFGLALTLEALPGDAVDRFTRAFAETPSRYLLQVREHGAEEVARKLADAEVPFAEIGVFDRTGTLSAEELDLDADLTELEALWRAPLDWNGHERARRT